MAHFDPDVFAYDCALILDDGSEIPVDLEVHGWAEAKRLARVKTFTLIPKDGIDLPIVVTNIPEGAKPVFKHRVKANVLINTGAPIAKIRIYGVGYKKGRTEHLLWVLPNGAIEVGPDSPMADLILDYLKALAAAGGTASG